MTFVSKHLRLLLPVMLVWPLSGAATVSSSPRELVIAPIADGKTSSFKNSVWIVADDNITIQILAHETGSGGTISLSAIRVNPTSMSLEKGTQKELAVSVDTTLLDGTFNGELVITKPPEPAPILKIPITVRLTPKPAITVVPATFAFKAVRCGSWVACTFSDLVLPRELNGDSKPWQLFNQTTASVDWTQSVVILRGDKGGNPFSDLSVTLPNGDSSVDWSNKTKLPPKKTVDAKFKFDRATLQPDHYQGQYRIEVKDGDPIIVPFTFDVRDGIVWPLIVLIAGIVLGRLIQSTNAPRAQAQLRLMDKFHSVALSVERIPSTELRQSLQGRLDQIMVDIRTMARSEADISTQLDVILRLAADSDKLDLVEPAIERLSDPALKARLTTLLASARKDLLKGDFAAAEKDLDSINSGLGGGSPLTTTLSAVSVVTPRTQAKPNMVVRALSWLSGAEPLDGPFFYTYARPFLFLLLLVLLASVGLYNSYVKNATFGVEGYFDYLALFLWGLSADVAQKTLQNLSLSR